MIELILDASMFAIPNLAVSEQEAEQIIFKVQDIQEWMDNEYPVHFRTHFDFDGCLESLYPDYASIQAFLEMNGLSEVYSTRDIFRVYHSIIERVGRCGDDSIGEPLEVIDASIEPDICKGISPVALRNSFQKTIAACLFRRNMGVPSYVIAPNGAAEPSVPTVNFECSGAIQAGKNSLIASSSIEGEVTVFSGLFSLFSSGVAYDVWQHATCAQGIYSAIWIGALEEHLKNDESISAFNRGVSVGSGFYSSLRDNQCDGSGEFSSVTLKSCIYCLQYPNVISHKKFQGERPRARDGAEAFRSHITKGNPALRLLTWEKGGSQVEFANVGPKKELCILRGDPSGSYP